MYEYSEGSNPLTVQVPSNVDIFLDNIPLEHPYVARLCKEQAHILVWHGSPEEHPELHSDSLRCKDEPQNVTCNDSNKIETAMAIVWEYDDEVILGTVKYYGYVYNRYGRSKTLKLSKEVWNDIIKMFGHKRMICPAASYLEYVHLVMNQERIPSLTYRSSILKPLGFKRVDNYWVRDANLLA